ncbi:MAG: hypothetical protein ABIP17_08155 [Ilumatobacteraceae bacterium]
MDTVEDVQPVVEVTADWPSLTVQTTETSERYQPSNPWVPLIVGVISGGVVSVVARGDTTTSNVAGATSKGPGVVAGSVRVMRLVPTTPVATVMVCRPPLALHLSKVSVCGLTVATAVLLLATPTVSVTLPFKLHAALFSPES